jgi:mannose-1-phosphate guanylyltransferase
MILAGGRGERFGPMSLPGRPKQLLPLADGKVLLSTTLDRLDGIVAPERTIIVTSRDLAKSIARLVGDRARVVAEPVGRNTAPAVGLAAHLALALGADDAMIVLSADHLIHDLEVFRTDLVAACQLAEAEDRLVTFGIRPDRPETGYGYIERGHALESPGGRRAFVVKQFREKPDEATAKFWADSNDFLWNSGMFVWRPRVVLAALATHRPELAARLAALAEPAAAWAKGKGAALDRALEASFAELESISIDYAILEKAENAAMIEASFAWDDLGSWGAWARRRTRDERGNVVEARAMYKDSDDFVVPFAVVHPFFVLGARRHVVVQHDRGTLVRQADRVVEAREAAGAVEAKGWMEGGDES